MTPSDIRSKLRAGRASLGSWLQIPSTAVAEIIGAAGYDWVAIDLEHGSIAIDLVPDLCIAIRQHGTVPLVRVAQNGSKDIAQALDGGAGGVIVPMINTETAAQAAVRAASYPPDGCRGVGFSRANLLGQNISQYLKTANAERLVIVQIEHIEAIRQCDAIFRVPGIDAAMIGPYDLSGSLGRAGDFKHPEFLNALDQFRKVAKQREMPVGMHITTPDPELLKDSIAQGYQFIAYCVDGVFLWHSARCPNVIE